MGTKNTHASQRLFAVLLASTSALALPAPPAAAQQLGEPAAATLRYDIPAQPLSGALTEFARQSGVTILFPHERLARLHAPALRGAYARDEALALLLANSGFEASLNERGAIQLVEQARPQRQSAEGPAHDTAILAGDGAQDQARHAEYRAIPPEQQIVGKSTR